MSYDVWSLDGPMNERSVLLSVLCQVHQSWQLYLSPVSDVMQPLPSSHAWYSRHGSERDIFFHGWVTYCVTKLLELRRLNTTRDSDSFVPGPRHLRRAQRTRFSVPCGDTTFQMSRMFSLCSCFSVHASAPYVIMGHTSSLAFGSSWP